MIWFLIASDLRPSAKYSRWYSKVTWRFLFVDRILHNLRHNEFPSNVVAHIPSVLVVPQPAHVPD